MKIPVLHRVRVLLAFLLFAAAGCVAQRARILTAAENGTTCVIAPGETATIRLEANPTTGYNWSFALSGKGVEFMEQHFSAPDAKRCGTPGVTELRIRGTAPGTAKITAFYRRPWEKSLPSDQKWSCVFHVK